MATHHFIPDHYHTNFGPHAPVLHIQDGDTVLTTTVDAGGYDKDGKEASPGGNPQTGPFTIEGAEPGDTLAVHLDRLAPNRDKGFSGTVIAPWIVDAWDVRQLPEPKCGWWKVDRDAWTATLLEPETKLGRFTLPLFPMLGCFGVAPPNKQAINTGTSGSYGGNMDYAGFVEGVTVFFPVYEPGALFTVGDGHAIQGDGEIVGTGIEVSFDVQFTVHLMKGKQIHWPRGENEEYIFTVGNARPLDQAVQHATSEMLRWLNTDYGLDHESASLLMGMCVKYDMGNVFDPAYTMVCKLPKRVLKRIGAKE
jgi:acetamidase/formamidase